MVSASKPQPITTGLPGVLQRYFEVALYLMVVTGFGTLASTGGLGFTTVLLVSAALLFRGYLMFRGRAWTDSRALDHRPYGGLHGVLRGGLPSDFARISQRHRSSGLVRNGGAVVFSASRSRFLLSFRHCVPHGALGRAAHRGQCFPVRLCGLHADGRGVFHPDGDAAHLRQGWGSFAGLRHRAGLS